MVDINELKSIYSNLQSFLDLESIDSVSNEAYDALSDAETSILEALDLLEGK